MDFANISFLLAVDTCFIINTINYERGLIRDKYNHDGEKSLYDLLNNEENIYEYYSKNNIKLPDVLNQGYYAHCDIRIINGKPIKDYYRFIDRHKFLLLCKNKGIKFCAFPSVIGELIAGDNGNTSIMDGNTFKKFFTCVKIPKEIEEDYFKETIDLAYKYVKNRAIKFEYNAFIRQFIPQNDAFNQAEPTIAGISFLTDDYDFIKRGQKLNTERAELIEKVNIDNGYIFEGTNGVSVYDDYHPKPLTVTHAYSKLIDNKLTFPTETNLIKKEDYYIYIPPML